LLFKTGNSKNQDQKESPPVKNTSTLILIAEFSYERECPQPHGFLDTRIAKQCLPKSQAEDRIASWGRGVSTDAAAPQREDSNNFHKLSLPSKMVT
jgi:hypothetical protein